MNLNSSSFVAESDLLDALEKHSTALDTSTGQVLFRQGSVADGIYIVREGEVIISMASPLLEEILVIRAAPNSLLGLPAVMGNAPLTLSATALADSQVSHIDRETFSLLMLSQPNLALMVLRVLASEVRTARLALASLQEAPSSARRMLSTPTPSAALDENKMRGARRAAH
jgi:CRP/FNR family transcriptional regulator